MTVKDNQPRLLADLTTFFNRPPGPDQDLRTVEQTTKAHGRLETRTLSASADATATVRQIEPLLTNRLHHAAILAQKMGQPT